MTEKNPDNEEPSLVREIKKWVRFLSNAFITIIKAPLKGKINKLLILSVLLMLILQFDLLTYINEKISVRDLININGYTWIGWTIVGLLFIINIYFEIKKQHSDAVKDKSVFEKDSPIVGLFSFQLKHAEIFKNLERNEEIRNISAALLDDTFRFGYLSGVSGCGKSSFIKAGLLPVLKSDQHHCYVITFTNEDPVDTIRKTLNDELNQALTASALLTDILRDAITLIGNPKIILVFDQFEQFFTQKTKKEDRLPFINELKKVYFENSKIKILFSVRTDFMGRLHEIQEVIRYSTDTGQNYFDLNKFASKQVANILKYIGGSEKIKIDEGFIESVAREELAGKDGLISAVDVQILALTVKGLPAEERGFNKTAFQKIGGIEGLLQRFLKDRLNSPNPFNRNQEALTILLALIDIEKNVRAGQLSRQQLNEKVSSITSQNLNENLNWLEERRLIYRISDEDIIKYELAHERLIEPIRNIANKSIKGLEKANLLLENRTNEWLGNQRSNRYILAWREIRLIKKHFQHIEWGKNKLVKEEFLKASQKRVLQYKIVFILLIILPVLFFTIYQSDWYQLNYEIKNRIKNITSEDIIIRENDGREQIEITDSLANTDPELALEIIVKLEKEFQDKAYESFCTVRLEKDSSSLKELIPLTAKITDTEIKADVFILMAKYAEKLRMNDKVFMFLDSAFQYINKTDDNAIAFRSIIENVNDFSLSSAENIFNTILNIADDENQNESHKDILLTYLAQNVAYFNESRKGIDFLKKILIRSDNISNENDRANILGYLSESAGKNKNSMLLADEFLKMALQKTNTIANTKKKAGILITFSKNAVYLNDSVMAEACLDSALKNAIHDITPSYSILDDIAEQAVKLRNPNVAHDILYKILPEIERIPIKSERIDLLSALAKYEAKIASNKFEKKSLGLVDKLLTNFESIQLEKEAEYRDVSYALSELTRCIIKTCSDEKLANNYFDRILHITKKISWEWREGILENISDVISDSGRCVMSYVFLNKLLPIADNLLTENGRSRAMIFLAKTPLDKETPSKVHTFFNNIMKTRENDSEKPYRSIILGALAENIGSINDARLQKVFLNDVFQSIEEMNEIHKIIVLDGLTDGLENIDGEIVSEIVNKIFQYNEEIENEETRSNLWISLIGNIISIKKPLKVYDFFNKFMQSAFKIKDNKVKCSLLNTLIAGSEDFENSKMTISFLDQLSKKVLGLEDINDSTVVAVLNNIAKTAVKSNNYDLAEFCLDSALQRVIKIKEDDNKFEMVRSLLDNIKELIKSPRTLYYLDLVLQLSSNLNDQDDKITAMKILARAYLENGSDGEIELFIEQTIQWKGLSGKASVDHKRTLALLYLKLGKYREAYNILSEINNRDATKVLTYICILDCWNKKSTPNLSEWIDIY